MALPDSDTTGDVGLAGGDLERWPDRAAAIGLLLDASVSSSEEFVAALLSDR
jgi:hypothetical protein